MKVEKQWQNLFDAEKWFFFKKNIYLMQQNSFEKMFTKLVFEIAELESHQLH